MKNEKQFNPKKHMRKMRKKAVENGLCSMCLKNKVIGKFRTCLSCRKSQQNRYKETQEKLKRLEELEREEIKNG
jgi:hypothetical protein